MKISSQKESQSSLLTLFFLILIVSIVYYSIDILIFTIIGVGIGTLIAPILEFIQVRLKMKRGFAALLVILGALVILTSIGYLFGTIIFEQADEFLRGMSDFSSSLQERSQYLFSRFPFIVDQIKKIDISSAIQTSIEYLFKGAQIGSFAISGFLFSLILGIYLAVDSDKYFKGAVSIFYPKYRQEARDILMKIAGVVRSWFRAQLIDMVIIGLLTTVGLWIVGVNYWALFGFLTGLLGIIPYVGIIIVLCCVSFIVLISEPSQFGWVLLVFFITQQIEGNFILPLVMRGAVEIPEALLIVTMIFFSIWFGIIGVFIAPPIVAVFLCLYKNIYLSRIEN